MQRVLFYLAAGLVKLLQRLPLPWVARLGRFCGGLAYWLDARHRRVAVENLTRCFGREKSLAQIRGLAHENFRRLGENYCSAIKTAAMTWPELQRYVEFVHTDKIPVPRSGQRDQSCVVAIGHFGNFELYAHLGQVVPGYLCATTYRALNQPSLDRLLRRLRECSGCRYFERRTESAALRSAFNQGPVLLGLLADQHSGHRGVAASFFGQTCSTTPAPALFALRYRCPLYTGICYRVGLGRWRIESGDKIPTHEGDRARSVEDIMTDVNQAFETAVRRDPANWFWVHKRWKPFRPRHSDRAKAPPSERIPSRDSFESDRFTGHAPAS